MIDWFKNTMNNTISLTKSLTNLIFDQQPDENTKVDVKIWRSFQNEEGSQDLHHEF